MPPHPPFYRPSNAFLMRPTQRNRNMLPHFCIWWYGLSILKPPIGGTLMIITMELMRVKLRVHEGVAYGYGWKVIAGLQDCRSLWKYHRELWYTVFLANFPLYWRGICSDLGIFDGAAFEKGFHVVCSIIERIFGLSFNTDHWGILLSIDHVSLGNWRELRAIDEQGGLKGFSCDR